MAGLRSFPFLQSCNPAILQCLLLSLQSFLLSGPAPRRIHAELLRRRLVAGEPRRGELEHPWHLALAKDGIAENLVAHVPALRREAGVLDVADDFGFVHAIARAGGADNVLLDHDAAHVVRAERETELADLAALRHPRGLEVVEVVKHDPRDCQR